MQHLDHLESQSVSILREAHHAISKLAMLWSFGKDSTVMIHLARKAFFSRVPFPVIHCDTGIEMDEAYDFRDRYAKEWDLNFIGHPCPPLEATDPSLPHAARVASRKTLGLREAITQYGFTGIITGIRRDEEATRAKERVFSPRSDDGQWNIKDQPPEFWNYFNTHTAPGTSLRIHPLLAWTERDIWQYIKRESIPMVPLYFAKDGMRYRSLGEKGITHPLASHAATIDDIIAELDSTRTAERSGRPMGADEDESAFERMRMQGYL